MATRLLAAVSLKSLIEIALVAVIVSFAAAQAFHPFQRGALDIIGPDRVAGWAYDPTSGDELLRVQLFIDGAFLAETQASEVRPDLVAAGVANRPEHGFSFSLDKTRLERGDHSAQVYTLRQSLGGNLSLIPILKEPVRFNVN